MHYHFEKLEDVVERMRDFAHRSEHLTFPQVPLAEEYIILPLKIRHFHIDGYEVILNFSRSIHNDRAVECLQIQSAYTPFLPFDLVCKLGFAFLADEHLCFTEFMKGRHKLYCWTLLFCDGETLSPDGATDSEFEDYFFKRAQPSYLQDAPDVDE